VPCETFPASAARLGVAPTAAAERLRAALARGERPELVIANPPRGGLGSEVTALLLELAPFELRIMSCSAKTLARDLAELEAAYERAWARAYDTLPQTGHLELVVALRRR
jgi:tRNA/tmRNA/rRNA uracil-C5-methylase (TrmA/RlmC/RlmD family)